MAGQVTGKNNLLDFPYAVDFIHGTPNYKELISLNRLVQEVGDNKDYFVVLSPAGAHQFSVKYADARWYEIWYLIREDPPFAHRFKVVCDPITLEPHDIDQRITDFLAHFDMTRRTDRTAQMVRQMMGVELLKDRDAKEKEYADESHRKAVHDIVTAPGAPFCKQGRITVPVALVNTPAVPVAPTVPPVAPAPPVLTAEAALRDRIAQAPTQLKDVPTQVRRPGQKHKQTTHQHHDGKANQIKARDAALEARGKAIIPASVVGGVESLPPLPSEAAPAAEPEVSAEPAAPVEPIAPSEE